VVSARESLERVDALWTGIISRSAREALAGLSPSLGERVINRLVRALGERFTIFHLLTWFTFPDWKQRPLIFFQDTFPSREYMEWRYGSAPLGIWPLLYARRFFQSLGMLFRSS
jgi:hypothetical protein